MLKNIVCWLFLLGSLGLGWANIREKYSIDITNENRNNVVFKPGPFVNITNRYYHFSRDTVNWFVAFETCRILNSELVTFETADEFDDVTRYLNSLDDRNNYWTSGNDLGRKASHKWFTNGQRITIAKWAPHQPDNAGGIEHCVHVGFSSRRTYILNDRPCANHINSPLRYICETPGPETISIVVWK